MHWLWSHAWDHDGEYFLCTIINKFIVQSMDRAWLDIFICCYLSIAIRFIHILTHKKNKLFLQSHARADHARMLFFFSKWLHNFKHVCGIKSVQFEPVWTVSPFISNGWTVEFFVRIKIKIEITHKKTRLNKFDYISIYRVLVSICEWHF